MTVKDPLLACTLHLAEGHLCRRQYGTLANLWDAAQKGLYLEGKHRDDQSEGKPKEYQPVAQE
jgi:hypothetical protein